MSSFGQPHLAKMFFRLAMVVAADMLVRWAISMYLEK
jgi:hypothetical protein